MASTSALEEPTVGATSSTVPDSTPASTSVSAGPDNSPTTTVAPEEPAGNEAEPTTTRVEASTTQAPTTTTQSETVVAISDDVPDYDMIDVYTGDTVNLRTVVKGDKPLLFWFWSPL